MQSISWSADFQQISDFTAILHGRITVRKPKATCLQAKMKSKAEHPVVDALYPLMLALSSLLLDMHSNYVHQSSQVCPFTHNSFNLSTRYD